MGVVSNFYCHIAPKHNIIQKFADVAALYPHRPPLTFIFVHVSFVAHFFYQFIFFTLDYNVQYAEI